MNRTMRNTCIIGACLTAFLQAFGQNSQPASPSPAAVRHAAFAGVWRLDLTKSNMGSDHPDTNYGFTKTFELKGSTLLQKDHEINVDIIGFAMPERNSTAELVPDRQERTVEQPAPFPGMPPVRARITVEWQGDNLIVSESGQSFIGATNTSRRYYISEDGAELIEDIVGHTLFGDVEQKLVFASNSK